MGFNGTNSLTGYDIKDGTVRQHDLRVRHSCRGGCPAPLVHVEHSLYTLSMSPLTPYQFVVAGSSPFVSHFQGTPLYRAPLIDVFRVISSTGDTLVATSKRSGGSLPTAMV